MKTLWIVLVALALVAGIVAAPTTEEQAAGGKLTYGKCVSKKAMERKQCYAETKKEREGCFKSAADDEIAQEECRNEYRKNTAECKAEFKREKKEECASIKHNFLATIGSSMK